MAPDTRRVHMRVAKARWRARAARPFPFVSGGVGSVAAEAIGPSVGPGSNTSEPLGVSPSSLPDLAELGFTGLFFGILVDKDADEVDCLGGPALRVLRLCILVEGMPECAVEHWDVGFRLLVRGLWSRIDIRSDLGGARGDGDKDERLGWRPLNLVFEGSNNLLEVLPVGVEDRLDDVSLRNDAGVRGGIDDGLLRSRRRRRQSAPF